ncbi:Imm1 family immunity protein [Actinosynnema sp. NPDC047251]|uniref:Uncharacterized protein n=1 Tax=Saccharothrix espanaensis (strain ATCC 51144 / DSM 44229 / JCM 9112 / NBRC 15066 / NRRL 15764) TaxID=1179773 RepID=K0JQV7_SACES|nr:Imm1 family immunity protein [Saccharothrix espanaensis]CCH29910.1 hypothetical protein BN6_25970 [Saccharothrix espanaensis DSM 44229]
MIVTALLANGTACVASGKSECVLLIDRILGANETQWESTLSIGDVEYRKDRDGGPFPNHQLRISVDSAAGFAAINYLDNDDLKMPVANSYNPKRPPPDLSLIFNGTTGALFPRSAAILISDARRALIEWIETRQRPKCIEWMPYDGY